MNNLIRRTGALARLAVIAFLTAGLALTTVALDMDLGSIRLLRASAQTMDGVVTPGMGDGLPPPHATAGDVPRNLTRSLGQSLGSYGFLSGVGGIAFEGVAQPTDALKVLWLSYRPFQPDGRRLLVAVAGSGVGTQEVVAAVYDWQLVPIARFADSPVNVCFTLFGNLKDAKEQLAHKSQGHEIMNYHSAFVDTLLGLRLMQADMMFLYDDCRDLPKEDGKYLLGAGERQPDLDGNRRKIKDVHSCLADLDKTFGGPFQSYVICDYRREVRFGVKDGALTLTGDPQWYCWRTKPSVRGKLENIVRRANESGNRWLNAEMMRDRSKMSPAEFSAKYSDASSQALFDEYVDGLVSAEVLESMTDYSHTLSKKVNDLGGINQPVYDALVATMRYAAFFRYVKKTSPRAYADFMKLVNRVRPAPAVTTPSIMVGALGTRTE